jgi:hypothetical protein
MNASVQGVADETWMTPDGPLASVEVTGHASTGLLADLAGPGELDGASPGCTQAVPDTNVTSLLVHHVPSDAESVHATLISGYPIVGVIGTDSCLLATDAELGNAGTTYSSEAGRGIEASEDTVVVDASLHQLTLTLAGQPLDQVRVLLEEVAPTGADLTLACPEMVAVENGEVGARLHFSNDGDGTAGSTILALHAPDGVTCRGGPRCTWNDAHGLLTCQIGDFLAANEDTGDDQMHHHGHFGDVRGGGGRNGRGAFTVGGQPVRFWRVGHGPRGRRRRAVCGRVDRVELDLSGRRRCFLRDHGCSRR